MEEEQQQQSRRPQKKKKKKRRVSGRCSFYDLNIETDALSLGERTATLTTALQLGFSGVAWNHVMPKGSMPQANACKTRALDLQPILELERVGRSARFHRDVLCGRGAAGEGEGEGPGASSMTAHGRPFFRQFDRLTVVVENSIQASALNASNPVIRSYDLVAVRPTNSKIFDQACMSLEIDIISLDLCHRLPFAFKASSVKAAVQRGVFFEVCLSGVFSDPKARRELFANAQMLQRMTRGRNIIISSGARQSVDLRGPYDIANMAHFFGLSREAAKSALSNNCKDAILRGLSRKRTYKSAIIVDSHPAWNNEPLFSVPEVWDPLSNSRLPDSLSFEKRDGEAGLTRMDGQLRTPVCEELLVKQSGDNNQNLDMAMASESGQPVAPGSRLEAEFKNISVGAAPKLRRGRRKKSMKSESEPSVAPDLEEEEFISMNVRVTPKKSRKSKQKEAAAQPKTRQAKRTKR